MGLFEKPAFSFEHQPAPATGAGGSPQRFLPCSFSDNQIPKPIILRTEDPVKSITYTGRAIAPFRSAMRTCLRDLRFAARVLQTSPAFTAITVLTLGLGMACTTTVFSWVDSVLLHPYPGAASADELAGFEMVTPSSPNGGTSVSWTDF